jgi:hypothetical protein
MLSCRGPGPHYLLSLSNMWCARWHGWLRHCCTSRKVVGSISDVVIGIIHCHNPSGRTMTLGSTQPLTEMSTRNIYWGKGGRCLGLTTLPPSYADWLEIWEPQLLWNPRECTFTCILHPSIPNLISQSNVDRNIQAHGRRLPLCCAFIHWRNVQYVEVFETTCVGFEYRVLLQ